MTNEMLPLERHVCNANSSILLIGKCKEPVESNWFNQSVNPSEAFVVYWLELLLYPMDRDIFSSMNQSAYISD